MSLTRTFAFALALLALPMFACVEDQTGDKGLEEELPSDGKLDSFAHPTDHGAIAFNTAVDGTLTTAERYHTWTFDLSAAATVHTFTGPGLASRRMIDTVLYLYKQRTNGTWGAYIARNDDDGGSILSSITKDLDAGHYRVLVKGYAASTRGQFAVTVGCTGAGCQPANTCLFGATFGDLLASTGYAITGDRVLHVADVPSPGLEASRVILAVQQSAHTDVMTVAQAFAAVDGNEIRRVDLYDEAGARSFVALEYGSGDNSYGAVFAYNSTTIVSKIHDGDLEACTAKAQACLLGPTWVDTKNGGAFVIVSSNVVTAASQLTGNDATDALAAIRVAYTESTSLADGLTRIDGHTLNVIDLRHTATNTVVRAFEYGAGDNSYGALYRAGTTEKFASIVDLTYYDCTFTH
jgi:hypothetical protein